MELIEQGEKAGLIRLDDGRKVITYVAAGKGQLYTDPYLILSSSSPEGGSILSVIIPIFHEKTMGNLSIAS